jgi:hypothetical protein
MTPYAFGEKIAAKIRRQRIKRAVGSFNGMPGRVPGYTAPAPTAGAPSAASASKPAGGSLLNDMSNNSARVAGGILSTAAGGLGTALTGIPASANYLWNSATPKSMNTSNEWTAGVNNAFNKSVEFTNAGARDVYGGLGGNTNYDKQQAWEKMEEGFNDPNVDPTTRNIASASGWTGHGAWNTGMAVMNPGKALANAPQLGKFAPAAARVGQAINKADDFGATPTELVNLGQRTISGISKSKAEAQQGQQQQPTPSYSDLAAERNMNQNYTTYMRDTLSGKQTPHSYSHEWQNL